MHSGWADAIMAFRPLSEAKSGTARYAAEQKSVRQYNKDGQAHCTGNDEVCVKPDHKFKRIVEDKGSDMNGFADFNSVMLKQSVSN